jgi:hypothetical protein
VRLVIGKQDADHFAGYEPGRERPRSNRENQGSAARLVRERVTPENTSPMTLGSRALAASSKCLRRTRRAGPGGIRLSRSIVTQRVFAGVAREARMRNNTRR